MTDAPKGTSTVAMQQGTRGGRDYKYPGVDFDRKDWGPEPPNWNALKNYKNIRI